MCIAFQTNCPLYSGCRLPGPVHSEHDPTEVGYLYHKNYLYMRDAADVDLKIIIHDTIQRPETSVQNRSCIQLENQIVECCSNRSRGVAKEDVTPGSGFPKTPARGISVRPPPPPPLLNWIT